MKSPLETAMFSQTFVLSQLFNVLQNALFQIFFGSKANVSKSILLGKTISSDFSTELVDHLEQFLKKLCWPLALRKPLFLLVF